MHGSSCKMTAAVSTKDRILGAAEELFAQRGFGGASLRRHCEAKLAEAEARVQAIVSAGDGSLSLRESE